MQTAVLVGLGGACGAMLRYAVVDGWKKCFLSSFPYGTLTVNLSGSLLIGMLWAWQSEAWSFLVIGFLGALTTFSSLIWELIEMLEQQRWKYFLIYATCSLLLAVGGAASGYYLIH